MKTALIILTLSVISASCKKSFLTLDPVSSIQESDFYKTAADIELAVNGAYASLKSDGQYRIAIWQIGEVRSDNTYNWEGGGNFADAELDQFKESAFNSILNAMWIDSYQGILLCNIVLDKVVQINIDSSLRDRFNGEMYFLRALIYFNLVRTFGDVPLVLKPQTIENSYLQGRMAVDSVYDQITADLQAAAGLLPTNYVATNTGRATSGAAKSLLGKIYLTRKKFGEAAAVLQEVVLSGRYRLLKNYADLWLPSNANHAESIFEVQYKKGGVGMGSPYVNFFAPRNSERAVTRVGFAYGRNLPTADLVQSFEVGDHRKNASLAESYSLNGQTINAPYTIKYRDVPLDEGDADNNWTVLRFADVLLMYSEALNEINNGPNEAAYKMIDSVRNRAGLSPLSRGLTKTAFLNKIDHERRVELAFEGHRWFDLIRMDGTVEVMNKHFNGSRVIEPYQLLFPIPQSQINVNAAMIKQNPGY